jgi:hypothetical protein
VQAQPLIQGGQPVPLLIVGLADGSARVVALGYDAAGGVKSLVDLHTTPNATVKVSSDLPAKLAVSESVYPPPGSGLNPQYSQPVGALALTYDWKDSAFVAEGPGDLALGCLSGTVAAIGKQDGKTTLLLQCPDGSSAPYSAVLIADATSLSDGIATSDIQSGDDATLTVDPAALKASDPLNVLPAAASVQSNAALARKKAREATPTPAPAPAPAPVPVAPRTSSGSSGSGSSGSSSSSGSTYTPPVSSAPAPQPVQPAPQPVQPAPQPVATQPPAPVNNNPGLGGGQSSGPGGGGLGGGSGSTGTGGGLGG